MFSGGQKNKVEVSSPNRDDELSTQLNTHASLEHQLQVSQFSRLHQAEPSN